MRIGGVARRLQSMFFYDCFPDQEADLEVDPLAHFRMQPCRFIRSDILVPLKALIDQFVSEGVLVSDIFCTYASPSVCS